jgi:hypothetical protein
MVVSPAADRRSLYLCNASNVGATALIGRISAGFAAVQRRTLHRKVTSDPIL